MIPTPEDVAPATAGPPWLVVIVFAVAGTLHFVFPGAYERIMPAWVPATGPLGRRALVLVSGACELLGAAGVLYAPTRRVAGWGLILLLAAVFPANLHMLGDAVRRGAPVWARLLLTARLPLQPLMMWWVWTAAARG